jgi:hypothetical protein
VGRTAKCFAPGGICVGSPTCDGATCILTPDEIAGVVAEAEAAEAEAEAAPAAGTAPALAGVLLVRTVEVRGELWNLQIKGAAGPPANLASGPDLVQMLNHQHDLILALATALLGLSDPRIDRILTAFGIQLKDPDGKVIWPR